MGMWSVDKSNFAPLHRIIYDGMPYRCWMFVPHEWEGLMSFDNGEDDGLFEIWHLMILLKHHEWLMQSKSLRNSKFQKRVVY